MKMPLEEAKNETYEPTKELDDNELDKKHNEAIKNIIRNDVNV